jgi:Na+/H+ antiporter NhaA
MCRPVADANEFQTVLEVDGISLFVTELAFETGPLADAARVGILAGSVIAGAVGYLALSATLPPRDEAVA